MLYKLKSEEGGGIVLILSVFLISCEENPTPPLPKYSYNLHDTLNAEPSENTAYQKIWIEKETGEGENVQKELVSEKIYGIMTNDIYQRAARPYTYAGPREPFLYHTTTTVQQLDDVTVYKSVTIEKTPNDNPVISTRSMPNIPGVHSLVWDSVSQAEARTGEGELAQLRLLLKMRDYPPYDIPLPIPMDQLDPSDGVRATLQREAAITARSNLLDMMAAPVIEVIRSAGGEVLAGFPRSGWLLVSVPNSLVVDLARRTDLQSILMDHEAFDNGGCDPACTLNTYQSSGSGYHHSWILGNGSKPEFANWNRFRAYSFTGGIANGSRHSWGRLVAGMVERHQLRDSACYLKDSGPCETSPSRLQRTYTCKSGIPCSAEAFDPADNDCGNDFHGIQTTSITAGSYAEYQGYQKQLEDPCWDANLTSDYHCVDWRLNSTGLASKANIHFFGHNGTASKLAASYWLAATNSVDVLNLTNTTEHRQCDPYDLSDINGDLDADEIENAYDDGVFVVIAAGNAQGTTSSDPDPFTWNSTVHPCWVDHPADTLKAFTVNSISTADTNCKDGDYNSCLINQGSSRFGGALAKSENTGDATALSMVDLIAPSGISYVSTCDTNNDTFTAPTQGLSGGSSFAAPHVSGAALMVKHWLLSEGLTDINSPGALFSVMLGMGDRYGDWVGARLLTGSDFWSGFGRLKLRLFKSNEGLNPYGYTWFRRTFSSGDQIVFPFIFPVPSGTDFVKCVAHTTEDMSGEPKLVHWTSMQVAAYQPSGGFLVPPCLNPGSYVANSQRTDGSRDNKHLVAFEGTDAARFMGKCLRVRLRGLQGVTGKAGTTTVFCYYSGRRDYHVVQ